MPEIPKPIPQAQITIGWPRNLFIFSLMLVLISAAASLALGAYKKILEGQNEDIDQEISDIAVSISPAEIQKLLTLDSQIKNLKQLLPNHVYFSRILDQLELNTHPQVRLVSFSVNQVNREISLAGSAPSTEVVSQQAAAYAAMKNIESVAIRNVSLDPKGQKFNFSVRFKPQLILP